MKKVVWTADSVLTPRCKETQRNAHNLRTQARQKKKKKKKNNSRVYVCELKVLLLYLEVIWCADALQRETKKMLERSVKDWNRQRTKTKKKERVKPEAGLSGGVLDAVEDQW